MVKCVFVCLSVFVYSRLSLSSVNPPSCQHLCLNPTFTAFLPSSTPPSLKSGRKSHHKLITCRSWWLTVSLDSHLGNCSTSSPSPTPNIIHFEGRFWEQFLSNMKKFQTSDTYMWGQSFWVKGSFPQIHNNTKGECLPYLCSPATPV